MKNMKYISKFNEASRDPFADENFDEFGNYKSDNPNYIPPEDNEFDEGDIDIPYPDLKHKYLFSGEEKLKSDIEDFDRDIPDVPTKEDDVSNICYLIRTLFRNSGIDYVDVDYNDLDFKVYVYLSKKEKMSSILKILDVSYKLKRDILPQYESSVELYHNKHGEPLFCFSFEYYEPSESKESDKFKPVVKDPDLADYLQVRDRDHKDYKELEDKFDASSPF